MKRGKSISDWMTSAMTKRHRSHGDEPHLSASSTQPTPHPPPSAPPPPVKKKRSKRKQTSRGETSGGRSAKDTTPLTAGTLLGDSDVPWSIKYQPHTTAELAVHKKKVTEVQQWLEFALSPQSRHPMLLLTGPPGCGKTATLNALAEDMGFSILEWVNPLTDTGGSHDREIKPGDLVLFPESQPKQFQNFLTRANRYPSVLMGGADVGGASGKAKKKVVLVEEFPNAFLYDPSKFHQVMDSVGRTLIYPLVFIVSESHRGVSSATKLFNKIAATKMDIHTISFNPVAHTSLVKTLQKISSAECQKPSTSSRKASSTRGSREDKFYQPPREVIESLAESSAGDIRSAINALQFACLRDSSDLISVSMATKKHQSTSSSGSKRSKDKSGRGPSGSKLSRKQSSSEKFGVELSTAIGGRDSSLFLFRALGKILYCKRDTESGIPECDHLPDHLKCHERSPLLVNPEVVVEYTHMSQEMFVLYLHQNYMEFFDDIEHIEDGVGYLSDADILGSQWTDSKDVRMSLATYSSSVACRGLMHSNKSTSGGKWRPLHKPQWNSVNKQYSENCRMARGLFLHLGASPYAHLWTPLELQTEILPYLAVINAPLRNTDQVQLLQTITHFKSAYQRVHPETLGEKDFEESQQTQDTESRIRPGPALAQSLSSIATSSQTGQADAPQSLSQSSSISTGVGSQSLSQDFRLSTGEPSNPNDDEIEDFDDDVIW